MEPTDIAGLSLQLAALKKLLGRFYGTLQVCSQGYQMRHPDHVEKLFADAEQAMNELPELDVVWRGRGWFDPTLGPMDEIAVLPDGEVGIYQEMAGVEVPQGACMLSVYAVKRGKEPESEQAPDTVQCSRRHEQSQKSEQEE